MKRQSVLLLSLLVAMAMVIAACGGGAPAAPAAEEAAPAAEEAATEEGAGEEAAADGEMALAAPIPFEVGEAPGGGGGEIATYPLEDLVRYEALDSYSQPEWMDAFVEDGTLPPVEERLPLEPQVIPTSGMSEGVGEYGGIWRDFSAVPTEGWNFCAGQTQGWFGINYIFLEALVESAPTFMRNDAVEPLPNLAKSWEWSEDGLELTMPLIEGAKWSDGEPFTAEDVMFTWEDNILDPNVNSTKSRTSWQINGEDINLEMIDDYTIKFTFPEPFLVAKLFDMDFLGLRRLPRSRLEALPSHLQSRFRL